MRRPRMSKVKSQKFAFLREENIRMFDDHDWDNIVNVEKNIVERGRRDGLADSSSDEAFSVGKEFGLSKGVALGLEVH